LELNPIWRENYYTARLLLLRREILWQGEALTGESSLMLTYIAGERWKMVERALC
jgi:hypothetical protein